MTGFILMAVLFAERWGVLRIANEKYCHHHLVCIKCGRAFLFQDDYQEGLEKEIAGSAGFCVVNHEVKLCSYCIECGGDLIEEKSE